MKSTDTEVLGGVEVETLARQKQKDSKTLFGHPVGLFVLFFTEMWERFSYYGMRALLVLYMTQYLIKSAQAGTYIVGFASLQSGLESVFGPLAIQPLASQIYGLYTGFVYFTPFFGGILADRVFGQRKTVIVGGILMAIGHFLMAFEKFFLVALLFLILGNGCFKPNISTQVGNLYPAGDQRRDGAFTIFYMGINLGAFLSPLICGTLGQKLRLALRLWRRRRRHDARPSRVHLWPKILGSGQPHEKVREQTRKTEAHFDRNGKPSSVSWSCAR